MAGRVIKSLGAKLHPEAVCMEDGCVWERSSSALTRDLAKDHVRATGHRVVVEAITRDIYRREE